MMTQPPEFPPSSQFKPRRSLSARRGRCWAWAAVFALLALASYGSIIVKVGTHGAGDFLARAQGKASPYR